MAYNNNHEIRMMMDRDVNELNRIKHLRQDNRDKPYKYGNQNNQEVVKGDIPEWANKALSTYKAGDVVGEYNTHVKVVVPKELRM